MDATTKRCLPRRERRWRCQSSAGAVYAAAVTAISDDILLSRQYLPPSNTTAAAPDEALQVLLARMELAGIRMYDAGTPPNYSRFSAAVFVNLPLSQ